MRQRPHPGEVRTRADEKISTRQSPHERRQSRVDGSVDNPEQDGVVEESSATAAVEAPAQPDPVTPQDVVVEPTSRQEPGASSSRTPGGGGGNHHPQAPISLDRLKICYSNATYWANVLPPFARQQQQKADFWSILAGLIASGTGLAIFPVLTDNSHTWEKVLVSVAAMAAAVCALIPRVKNYADVAGEARSVGTLFGPIRGELLDALIAYDPTSDDWQHMSRDVVLKFQAARERKDALRYLPERTEHLKSLEDDLGKRVEEIGIDSGSPRGR